MKADPAFYNSSKWMLENDISGIMFETFSVEQDNFGATTVIDLKVSLITILVPHAPLCVISRQCGLIIFTDVHISLEGVTSKLRMKISMTI